MSVSETSFADREPLRSIEIASPRAQLGSDRFGCDFVKARDTLESGAQGLELARTVLVVSALPAPSEKLYDAACADTSTQGPDHNHSDCQTAAPSNNADPANPADVQG